ncbi:amino acid adenylation domain-containing protein [Geomonas sp.]|uniref:amino acid adenylation domain-containing protein n=1 Tax=Geomonas sp. TaxID=2651584 RepID=UPI002B499DC7|nr:amino acid adenylation domain-containing protein [Geomonas sp.]HJV34265.1 amino acid adenylation domain-containing protein [Geomonas sp.]
MASYLLQSCLDAGSLTHPDKAALVDDRETLSYRALREEAERVAHALRLGGVKRQDRVVIWMRRSARVVVALLGTLKADAIYVPVDAKAPLERVQKVIGDCRPAAVICEEGSLPLLEEAGDRLAGVRMLLVCGGKKEIPRPRLIPTLYLEEFSELPAPPPYRNIDADAAYILYTSGSTGSPKGVTVSHLNVTSYIDWALESFRIVPDDKVLGTAPFHFDMSTFDIFASLRAGATLFIASERQLLFPNSLLDLIERNGITIWKGVSSLLMYLSSTGCLKPQRIPTLDRVLFGGEVLPTRHLINWMSVFPSKRFYNVYGPTEATGISAYHQVVKVPATAEEPVPIGSACANTEILLLTEENTLAKPGQPGEICIRGSGLSLGYWNDEEKTRGAFVPNPLSNNLQDRIYRTGDLGMVREDGLLEYLGRKDFQIKFMGYRIESFEVEKAMLALEGVQQAAVLLCNAPGGDIPELVGFVEFAGEADDRLLLEALGRALPAYMVPKRIVQLDRLPLSDRGKLDRSALRERYRQFQAGGMVA